MKGREFLDQARESLPGTLPRHRRSAIIHAYYALLLECRDLMGRWGLPPLTRQQVHAQVRLRLVFSGDANLKAIGRTLEDMGRRRNSASYDLRDVPMFGTTSAAQNDVDSAAAAFAALDAIDADPVRRAAAIASIKP